MLCGQCKHWIKKEGPNEGVPCLHDIGSCKLIGKGFVGSNIAVFTDGFRRVYTNENFGCVLGEK